MKHLVVALTFIISLSASAKLVSISTSSIEGLITSEGNYASVVDLQNGYESIDGVLSTEEKLFVNTNRVHSFVLHSGDVLALQGGDSGGGGGGGRGGQN